MARKSTLHPRWQWPEASPFPPEDYEDDDPRLFPSRGRLPTLEEMDIQCAPRPIGPLPGSPPPGRDPFALDTTLSADADDLPYTLHTHAIGPLGTPEMTHHMQFRVSAAGNAIRQEEVAVAHYLSFRQTADLLELTTAQLRSIVEAGELAMNQPKRDGRRRTTISAIEGYLRKNGTYSDAEITQFLHKAQSFTRSEARTNTAQITQTTETA